MRSSKRLSRRELRTNDSSSLGTSFAVGSSGFSSDRVDVEQGILKSNSLSKGLGKYGYRSPPLRMMQWNFSCATATGQYVSSFRPPARRLSDLVSKIGTHFACPGVRQCWRISRTPVESYIHGSPLSEKKTLRTLAPSGSATRSSL